MPVEFRASGLKGKGEVRNVSEGGLFVKTLAIPREGDPIAVVLTTPSRATVKLTGLVWWTTNDPTQSGRKTGFGVRVLDENEQYKGLLASLR